MNAEESRYALPSMAREARQSESPRKRIVIGVLADHDSIFGIGRAAFETWYPEVSEFADVYFAIGECSYPPEMKDAVLCLDTPDVYPPQVKEFKLWQHFAKYPKGKYDFFFKIDLDTYVNARPLQSLLAGLSSVVSRPMYFGAAASGRPDERGKLGLTKPYCLGLGYLLTYAAVVGLARHAEECMKDFKSTHSDTEVCLHLVSPKPSISTRARSDDALLTTITCPVKAPPQTLSSTSITKSIMVKLSIAF
jgi:hypothetical protein